MILLYLDMPVTFTLFHIIAYGAAWDNVQQIKPRAKMIQRSVLNLYSQSPISSEQPTSRRSKRDLYAGENTERLDLSIVLKQPYNPPTIRIKK